MAEFSGLWTTDASTPTGDQQASYTQAQLSTMMDILAACGKFEGVALGYGNELVPSDGGANTLNVASGGAIVDGKFYDNNATKGVNIPSAGAGTVRKDRVVLQADWASFTIRLTVLTGTAVSYPTLTTVSGTTYEIQIAKVEVDDAGSLTIVDERNLAAPEVDDDTLEIDPTTGNIKVANSGIDTLQIADNAITAAKIAAGAVDTSELAADSVTAAKIAAGAVGTSEIATGAVDTDELAAEAVTAAKIANRTRTIFIPASALYPDGSNATRGVVGSGATFPSITFAFGSPGSAYGAFKLPSDWGSGTISFTVVWTVSSDIGNVDFGFQAEGLAVGDSLGSTAELDDDSIEAIGTANDIQEYSPGSMAVTAGDYIPFNIDHNATSTTVTDGIDVLGVVLTYTADS